MALINKVDVYGYPQIFTFSKHLAKMLHFLELPWQYDATITVKFGTEKYCFSRKNGGLLPG